MWCEGHWFNACSFAWAAQELRTPFWSRRRAVMLSCHWIYPSFNVHTVAPTTASCHHTVQCATQKHQSRVTQRRGILPWWSKAAAGSLLVSFILKPSHAVSAGWWQTLVHKPHFTWAFTYAKGIAPMGKKRQSSAGKLAKELAQKANILSKKPGFTMDSWEELVSVIWLIKIRLWKNTASAKWVLFKFQL